MSTILSLLSGRQLTDADGVPQPGAKIYHYEANSLVALTVYTDKDGNPLTHAHPQPVVCDAGGFAPLIYIDDESDWKTVATTSAGAALPQYSFDNLPAAVAEASSVGFAPPRLDWTPVTNAASPVSLTAADAGKAYECDSTAGNITFNLPSAASAGIGKGFCFKKIVGGNSVFLDSNGSETIEGSTSNYTLSLFEQSVYIISDGAAWLAFAIVGDPILAARLPAASDTASGIIEIAVQSEMEAGTDALRAVVPARQQFHPSAAKFWLHANGAGTSMLASYNVTSITDTGTGQLTVNIGNDMSTANWAGGGTGEDTVARIVTLETRSASAPMFTCRAISGALNDPVSYSIWGFGDL